jgi:hypothetical protein
MMDILDELSVLFQFVKDWGLPLVLLFLLLRWLKPKADQLWNKAMGNPPANPGLVHHMAFVTKIDTKMSEIMHELLNFYDCQWVTLWQYHNGEYSLSGSPFLKISVTHQKYAPGKRGWADGYQRLPTSLIFSPALFDHHNQKITAENAGRYGYANLAQTQGIVTAYVLPIYNSSELHVANLTVSFDKEVDLSDEQRNCLDRFSCRIGGLLEINSIIPRSE